MAVSRSVRQIAPVRLRAEVVHGFGRGSRQLGFPTANLRIRWDVQDESTLTAEELEVLNFARHHETGIYCAYGCVEGLNGDVYKVAMSMGWNPTFADVKAKTIEPWILHDFAGDFYGHHLRLLVLGYVRPELKFESLEELIREIRADGDFCAAALDGPELEPLRHDAFLRPLHGVGGAAPAGDARVPSGGSVRLEAAAAAATGPLPAGIAVGSDLLAVLLGAPPVRPGCARLLLVRHAEALANERGLLCGGLNDSELSPNGLLQAERLAEELASSRLGLRLDLLGCSPLRRAAASADAIARRFPGVPRLAFEDLREMRYGALEGARIADVRGEMAELAQQWRSGQTGQRVGGGDGESPDEVADRALRIVAGLLEGRQGHTVLLVCHSWVIKALIAAVTPSLGLSCLLDVPQRNCAVNVLDVRCGPVSDEAPGPHLEAQVLGVDLLMSDVPSAAEGRL